MLKIFNILSHFLCRLVDLFYLALVLELIEIYKLLFFVLQVFSLSLKVLNLVLKLDLFWVVFDLLDSASDCTFFNFLLAQGPLKFLVNCLLFFEIRIVVADFLHDFPVDFVTLLEKLNEFLLCDFTTLRVEFV